MMNRQAGSRDVFPAFFYGTDSGIICSCQGVWKNETGFYIRVGSDIIATSRQTPEMEKHLGETVTLGIRPEDITVEKSPADLKGTLKVQENLGSEAYIYADYQGAVLTIKAPFVSDKKSGEDIYFSVRSEKVHIFHKDSGENISINL